MVARYKFSGAWMNKPDIMISGMISGIISIERKFVLVLKYPWTAEVRRASAALSVINIIPENTIVTIFSILTLYKIKITGIIIVKLAKVHIQSAAYLAKIILYDGIDAREFSKLPSSISVFIKP